MSSASSGVYQYVLAVVDQISGPAKIASKSVANLTETLQKVNNIKSNIALDIKTKYGTVEKYISPVLDRAKKLIDGTVGWVKVKAYKLNEFIQNTKSLIEKTKVVINAVMKYTGVSAGISALKYIVGGAASLISDLLSSAFSNPIQTLSGLITIFKGLEGTIASVKSYSGGLFANLNFKPLLDIKKAFTQVFGKIGPEIKVINNIIQSLINVAGMLLKPFTSAKTISSIFQTITKVFEVFFNVVLALVNVGLRLFGSFFKELFKQISKIGSIGNPFASLRAAYPFIIQLGTTIGKVLGTALQIVIPIVGTLISNIGKFVKILFSAKGPISTILDIFSKVGKTIKEALIKYIETLIGIYSELVQTLIDNGVFNLLGKIIKDLADKAFRILSIVLDKVKVLFKVLLGVVKPVISVFSTFAETILEVVDAMLDVLEQSSTLKGIFNGIIYLVNQLIDGFLSAGSSVMQLFITSAAEVFISAIQVVVDIIDTLYEGIVNTIAPFVKLGNSTLSLSSIFKAVWAPISAVISILKTIYLVIIGVVSKFKFLATILGILVGGVIGVVIFYFQTLWNIIEFGISVITAIGEAISGFYAYLTKTEAFEVFMSYINKIVDGIKEAINWVGKLTGISNMNMVVNNQIGKKVDQKASIIKKEADPANGSVKSTKSLMKLLGDQKLPDPNDKKQIQTLDKQLNLQKTSTTQLNEISTTLSQILKALQETGAGLGGAKGAGV